MWLEQVSAASNEAITPNWRYFSLNQNNHPDKDQWRIWEQPTRHENWHNEKFAPPLYYFWAAEAARRQSDEAFWRFHVALLTARHAEPKQTLYQREEVVALAASVELNMAQFEADFQDPSCLDRLAEDHQYSQTMDIFGTPTFVFPGAKPAYLKLDRILEQDEALDFWEAFKDMAECPYLLEIKRP